METWACQLTVERSCKKAAEVVCESKQSRTYVKVQTSGKILDHRGMLKTGSSS